LSGGTAMILAGGARPSSRSAERNQSRIGSTQPVLQLRKVVPGGGVALMRVASELEGLIKKLKGSAMQGAVLVKLPKPALRLHRRNMAAIARLLSRRSPTPTATALTLAPGRPST
jgi:chaperonin GroEL